MRLMAILGQQPNKLRKSGAGKMVADLDSRTGAGSGRQVGRTPSFPVGASGATTRSGAKRPGCSRTTHPASPKNPAAVIRSLTSEAARFCHETKNGVEDEQ